jgi:hypothetical protein
MKLTRIAKVAIATAAAAGLAVSTLSPANSATRSTVVLVTSNQLTGLNPSVTNMNLTFNSELHICRALVSTTTIIHQS